MKPVAVAQAVALPANRKQMGKVKAIPSQRRAARSLIPAKWRPFAAAAFFAATLLLFGAPILPTLGGIALAGIVTYYRNRKA